MLVSLKGGWSIVYYRVSLFVAFSFLRNIIIEFAYIYLYLNVASVLIPTLEQSPKKNIRFLWFDSQSFLSVDKKFSTNSATLTFTPQPMPSNFHHDQMFIGLVVKATHRVYKPSMRVQLTCHYLPDKMSYAAMVLAQGRSVWAAKHTDTRSKEQVQKSRWSRLLVREVFDFMKTTHKDEEFLFSDHSIIWSSS